VDSSSLLFFPLFLLNLDLDLDLDLDFYIFFLENLKGKQKKTLHLLHSSCKKKYEKISPKNA